MTPHDQHACNIAGFLATVITQTLVQSIVADAAAGHGIEVAISDALKVIPVIGWEAGNLMDALYQLAGAIDGPNLSDFTAASTDATLWGEVTCAIYSAIHVDGYVTASNLPAMVANIGGVSYAHADVITALAIFADTFGLDNYQIAQNAAVAHLSVDCSACGNWCLQFDSISSADTYTVYNPNSGTFVSGTGWESQYDPTHNRESLQLIHPIASATPIDGVSAWFDTTAGSPAGGSFTMYLFSGGSVVGTQPATVTTSGTLIKANAAFSPTTADQFLITWIDSTLSTGLALQHSQITGPGVNPFGSSDCTALTPP